MLTAFAGTFVLAAGPAALAATPATTSPEAISLVATGSVPIGPVGDATLSDTNPVTGASGVVTGLLGIGAFTDNVQTNAAPPGNTATSTVASVGPYNWPAGRTDQPAGEPDLRHGRQVRM